MRKLLNTLFILSEETYLSLDGENIVILAENSEKRRFPLHMLENIMCFSYKGASPALMGACAERKIGLSFFSPHGKFLAGVHGKEYGNVLLRKQQYRISDDKEQGLQYAKNMMIGKVYNSRWTLERTARDHKERVDYESIRKISAELQEGLLKIRTVDNIDQLRGIEGELASRYFSVFDELILNQKDDFIFQTRNRRPPMDRVNALLSFAYAVMERECANALRSVGLDPFVGFMHTDRPGRESMALDMMEEFRSILCDRFVLTLINTKTVRKDSFMKGDDGAVLLNDKGRKIFFNNWQNRKRELITHPFLKEKMEWGLVPYIQALLLARTIRGDIEEYPPFLWK
ncbi:type I-C CRISPR-associated endonuclease Cas1c [Kineothrix sp. MSJ-39]|uniref:type I-C CRISPR-associated endonuclease Cas1c n=1 Tax=Kineothrix sp. MSJ-39 TaxID=2841533 RepID=UPI001C10E0A7|nr:type I-C CRISPR-associated endonuclease Cas1c [Kineothrix sp. MSJ-39]MBU5430159.1 type I-C CRISPR-associated endonuclease Cas1c [Kineothrix sp. MSJ-39]